jgi:hypothetical protein
MASKWYRLTIGESNRHANHLQTSIDDLRGTTAYQLEIGRPALNWDPQSSLRSASVEDDGTPDDVLSEDLGLPVFSPRLQQTLTSAEITQADIQYLPLRLFQSTGEEIEGFAIANIIARVPALDYERCELLDQDESTIDPLTARPKVAGVWTIALKALPLQGHDIIRLVEFFPPIIVSERFVDVFRKGRFTGATFEQLLVR